MASLASNNEELTTKLMKEKELEVEGLKEKLRFDRLQDGSNGTRRLRQADETLPKHLRGLVQKQVPTKEQEDQDRDLRGIGSSRYSSVSSRTRPQSSTRHYPGYSGVKSGKGMMEDPNARQPPIPVAYDDNGNLLVDCYYDDDDFSDWEGDGHDDNVAKKEQYDNMMTRRYIGGRQYDRYDNSGKKRQLDHYGYDVPTYGVPYGAPPMYPYYGSAKAGKGSKAGYGYFPVIDNGGINLDSKAGKMGKEAKGVRCIYDGSGGGLGPNLPDGQPTPRPSSPLVDGSSVPTPVVSEESPECRSGCIDCDPDSPLPCPRSDMKLVCDKQNDTLYPPGNPRAGERISNFFDCYDMCKPSFCCIHDSLSETYSPSCADEYDNCPLYYPCYIIWWKLHDTIGPATYLRVEQDEPFYDGVDFSKLEQYFVKDQDFFQQFFGHHFDGDDTPTDDTFEDENNW